MAIQEWSKAQECGNESLERSLAAFDMFVLHDRMGDFEEVCINICYLYGLADNLSDEIKA